MCSTYPSAAFEATENHFRRWLTKGKGKQRCIKTIRFFFQSCVENQQCVLCSYSYKYVTDTLHLTQCILNLFSSLQCFRHSSKNSTLLILATILSPVVLTMWCSSYLWCKFSSDLPIASSLPHSLSHCAHSCQLSSDL